MKVFQKTKINQAVLSILMTVALPVLAADTVNDADKTKSDKAKTEAKKASETTTLSDVVVKEDFTDDGRPEIPSKTDLASPKTKVTRKQIESTNAVSTVDAIKYESGVYARQRYIGDTNAPVSMRGSNPYQGGRVVVNMDGMPI